MARDPFKGPVFWKRWWWQLRFSNPWVKRKRAKHLRLVGESEDDAMERERKRHRRLSSHRTGNAQDTNSWWRRLTAFQGLVIALFVVLLAWTLVQNIPALADRNPLVSARSRFSNCVERETRLHASDLTLPQGVRPGHRLTASQQRDLDRQIAALTKGDGAKVRACQRRTGADKSLVADFTP